MNVAIKPGRYVAAVSGGVDSMVLLDCLRRQPGVDLIVAHYDHGIRSDSQRDRQLVQRLAGVYGLPFVFDRGRLGSAASEATARTARYKFLHQVRQASGAQAIITAHHQDDLIETVVINLLRGTGRRGLSSLQSSGQLLRPLLNQTKADILTYAQQRQIEWHEDSTNQNLDYLRNRIRLQLLPKMSSNQRQQLLDIISQAQQLNQQIDKLIDSYLSLQPGPDLLDRYQFIMLSHKIAKEIVATWLIRHNARGFTAGQLERIVVFAKTYAPGKQIDVDKHWTIRVKRHRLALARRVR